MGEMTKPLPVQLFAGLIVNPAEGLDRAREALARAWGGFDMESPVWPFTWTEYYAGEMGAGLLRQFVVFEGLVEVEGLQRVKAATNEIEERLAGDSRSGVRRPVNIDPGYICHSKLVLFSMKDFSHRVYVGGGVFAEITLEWTHGEFVTHKWTFPDYRTAEYRNFFAGVRGHYVQKLKSVMGQSRFDSDENVV